MSATPSDRIPFGGTHTINCCKVGGPYPCACAQPNPQPWSPVSEQPNDIREMIASVQLAASSAPWPADRDNLNAAAELLHTIFVRRSAPPPAQGAHDGSDRQREHAFVPQAANASLCAMCGSGPDHDDHRVRPSSSLEGEPTPPPRCGEGGRKHDAGTSCIDHARDEVTTPGQPSDAPVTVEASPGAAFDHVRVTVVSRPAPDAVEELLKKAERQARYTESDCIGLVGIAALLRRLASTLRSLERERAIMQELRDISVEKRVVAEARRDAAHTALRELREKVAGLPTSDGPPSSERKGAMKTRAEKIAFADIRPNSGRRVSLRAILSLIDSTLTAMGVEPSDASLRSAAPEGTETSDG